MSNGWPHLFLLWSFQSRCLLSLWQQRTWLYHNGLWSQGQQVMKADRAIPTYSFLKFHFIFVYRNWTAFSNGEEYVPVKLYLDTGSASPYCKFQYLLEISLASPRESEKWVQGYLRVNLYGEEGEIIDYDLTPEWVWHFQVQAFFILELIKHKPNSIF